MEEVFALLWRKVVTCGVFYCYHSFALQKLIESSLSIRHYVKHQDYSGSCPHGGFNLVGETFHKWVHTDLCSILRKGLTAPIWMCWTRELLVVRWGCGQHPFLHPLEASSISHQVVTTKNVSWHCQIFLGGGWGVGENCLQLRTHALIPVPGAWWQEAVGALLQANSEAYSPHPLGLRGFFFFSLLVMEPNLQYVKSSCNIWGGTSLLLILYSVGLSTGSVAMHVISSLGSQERAKWLILSQDTPIWINLQCPENMRYWKTFSSFTVRKCYNYCNMLHFGG